MKRSKPLQHRPAVVVGPWALLLGLAIGCSLLLGALPAVASPSLGQGPASRQATPSVAFVARDLNVRDEAHLKLARESGEYLIEGGQATGTVPGPVKARLIVGVEIKISFVLLARGGTISGHGQAKLHSAGVYASFAGSLVITGGTGRYKHIGGGGQLYGVLNRETYATTVQFIGKMKY